MGFFSDLFDDTPSKSYTRPVPPKRPGNDVLTREAMRFVGNHYDSMPSPVKNYVMAEGKKKIAKEHPIADLFLSEDKKEELIIKHLKNQ